MLIGRNAAKKNHCILLTFSIVFIKKKQQLIPAHNQLLRHESQESNYNSNKSKMSTSNFMPRIKSIPVDKCLVRLKIAINPFQKIEYLNFQIVLTIFFVYLFQIISILEA